MGDQSHFNALVFTHFLEADVELTQVSARQRQLAADRLMLSKTDDALLMLPWTEATESSFIQHCSAAPPALIAQLRFQVQACASLGRLSFLDKDLTQTLFPLRLPLLANAILEDDFWHKKHPLKQVCDLLYQFSMGWQPGLSTQLDGYKTMLAGLVSDVLQVAAGDVSAYQQVLLSAQAQLSKSHERRLLLVKRLKESEIGALKTKKSKIEVDNFIFTLLNEKKLPTIVSEFIQQNLSHELFLLILREGFDAPLWLRWKKLLKLLVTAYQADDLSPKSKKMLSPLADEVAHVFSLFETEDPLSTTFCDQLAYDFALLQSSQPLSHLHQVEMKNMLTDKQVQHSVSKSLLAKTASLEEGQWFLWRKEDGHSRIQLSLKLLDYDQLLFNNFSGQKTLSKSLGDFSYLLSSGAIKLLPSIAISERIFAHNVEHLLQGFADVHQKKQLKRLDAKQQKQDQEQLVAKQQAAAKAKKEAIEYKSRQADLQRQQLLDELEGDIRRKAKVRLDTLALGSWIELQKTGTEQFQRAKLAVKFNATGRFIFVDQEGSTILEAQRDDLLNMVLEDRLRLLVDCADFNARLSCVIDLLHQIDESEQG